MESPTDNRAGEAGRVTAPRCVLNATRSAGMETRNGPARPMLMGFASFPPRQEILVDYGRHIQPPAQCSLVEHELSEALRHLAAAVEALQRALQGQSGNNINTGNHQTRTDHPAAFPPPPSADWALARQRSLGGSPGESMEQAIRRALNHCLGTANPEKTQ